MSRVPARKSTLIKVLTSSEYTSKWGGRLWELNLECGHKVIRRRPGFRSDKSKFPPRRAKCWRCP